MTAKAVAQAARTFPTLKAAWDDYGHAIAWDKLIDAKVSPTHGYVALAWDDGGGMVDYADLASPDGGRTWEMQNDGHEPVPLERWRKARCVPDCDWLDLRHA